MKYISTRGQAPIKNFTDVVTSGLASDGGLYVPDTIPQFSIEEIKSWKGLPYPKLAFNVIKPFVNGEIPDDDLQEIINKSCVNFTTENVSNLVKLEDDYYILELFHGPTLAFKDIALQFLGNLQDYILTKRNQDIVIIGATSGDTGSAAIYGVKDCKHVKIFMLHPHNKISEIQRHQMTTVISDNIFNIAVQTNFDDCQDMVKEMFKHPEFMKDIRLSAVNSINWARIVAQIVYYFQTVLNITNADKPVSFSVPSGNLGDVFGGYMAMKMGLPIDLLVVSTNENDILHRFFSQNDYSRHKVKSTVAPSMDIQVSSNFERLLFLEHNYDGEKVGNKMVHFRETGKMNVSENVYNSITKTFRSSSSNDEEIKIETKRVFDKYN
ncbi:MAG: threonine synthase, partial [Rickettsiales bacterium]|nr:threonine synthase [Rickettsiales bacterium]